MPTATEFETKIPVAGFEGIRQRLEALGATLERRVEGERHVVLAAPGLGADELLRLRIRPDGVAKLTWKGPPREVEGVRSREERTTAVSDPEATLDLLARLGCDVADRFLKSRELWRLADAVVVLDAMPSGAVVEVEGTPAAIHAALAALGLSVPSR